MSRPGGLGWGGRGGKSGGDTILFDKIDRKGMTILNKLLGMRVLRFFYYYFLICCCCCCCCCCCLLIFVSFFVFVFCCCCCFVLCFSGRWGGGRGGPEWVRGLWVGVAYSRLFTPNIGQIVYSFYGFVLRSRCPILNTSVALI